MQLPTRFTRISVSSLLLIFVIGTLSVLAGRALVTGKADGHFFQKLTTERMGNGASGKYSQPVTATRMATITVMNGNDSGAGSLRQAIADAVAGDTITFASGINLVSLTSGELVINKNLTIQGPGANLLTVQNTAAASATSRVFNISSGTVTLAGMTISGGNLTGGASGGGILNSGDLTLRDSVVTGNAVSGGNAGGIYNNGSSVSILNSTISNNSVTGIFFLGGGIFHDAGTMTLTNSTVSGNTNAGSTASLGGGIRAVGALILTNCTIANNTSSGSNPFGGGISLGNGGTLAIRNTIVSNNNANQGADIFGTINSLGYNLISNTTNTIINGITTGNVLGQPAQLVALMNNGGPTPTHALMTGSPAINAGDSCVMAAGGCGTNDPLTAFTTDQRGPGFPRQSGVQVDIGAFEVQFPCPSISVTNPATSTGTIGVAFSQTFTQTGGIGAITFSITSTLPTGLTLSSAGVLSGTPTQTGTFPIVVRATDSTTCFGDSGTYSLVISCQNNPVVTTNADSGAGSLRETIANACPGSTITFSGVSTVTLTTAELLINKNLTIDGGSGVTVTRSTAGGTPDFRIFRIASDTTVTLNRLAVTNGKVSTPFAIGGGIYNIGTLNLMNCAVSGNSCNPTVGLRAAWAGGIFSSGSGTLNVINSTLSGNSTSGIAAEGGGIYSGNNVTLINSTITGNSASGITSSRGGCVFLALAR